MAPCSVIIPSYLWKTETTLPPACKMVFTSSRNVSGNSRPRGHGLSFTYLGGAERNADYGCLLRNPHSVSRGAQKSFSKTYVSACQRLSETAPSAAASEAVLEAHTGSIRDLSQMFEQSTIRPQVVPNFDDLEDGPLKIVEFLRGKSILITGSTGFVGKVLVEKILRVQSDVKQLYLLIQPRAGVTPERRLEKEIIDVELFKVLRSKYGDEYKEFMSKKITAVGGNVASPNLGIDPQQFQTMAPTLDLIVHCAANTKFDERYDVILRDNTFGPTNVMNFAKKCPNMELFLHVSTAYVNGHRKGLVHEKPFRMGATIIEELVSENDVVPSSLGLLKTELPKLEIEFEMKLAQEAAKLFADFKNDEEMIQLGRTRARMFGWFDAYSFTKAMGEMLLFKNRGEIPLAIVRPSVVVSSYKEPFRGWIDGLRMMDPLAITYGKGQTPGFTANVNCEVDMIPVDVVINTILAAMAKHYGREQRKSFVYHSSSGSMNLVTFKQLSDSFYEHFKTYPMVDKQGNAISVERYRVFTDENEFELVFWQTYKLPALMKLGPDSKLEEKLSREYKRLQKCQETLQYISRVYTPYLFRHRSRFSNVNTEALLRQVCKEERASFGYSVSEIDWHTFWVELHLPGLRRYVLKEHSMQGLQQEHLE